MQINKTLIGTISIAVLLLFNPVAHAGNKHKHGGKHKNFHSATTHFTDYAKVVHVEPIFRRVEQYRPEQSCWYEEQEHTTHYRERRAHRRDHRPNAAQALVGGLVGGAIGNQIGRHSGDKGVRLGATVAGAIVGSAIANESHSRHRGGRHETYTVTESRPVKRCSQNYEKHYVREIVGYDVTYRYRGHSHTTRMQHDPGHRLPVRVTISPQG